MTAKHWHCLILHRSKGRASEQKHTSEAEGGELVDSNMKMRQKTAKWLDILAKVHGSNVPVYTNIQRIFSESFSLYISNKSYSPSNSTVEGPLGLVRCLAS